MHPPPVIYILLLLLMTPMVTDSAPTSITVRMKLIRAKAMKMQSENKKSKGLGDSILRSMHIVSLRYAVAQSKNKKGGTA